MYKKTIKRGEKEYTYYYTNVREGKKVRNIFLSSDRKEAIKLEKRFKQRDVDSPAPILTQPKERVSGFGGANKPFTKSFAKNGLSQVFLFLGIIIAAGLFLYLFSGITGFFVLENNNIQLDVNKQVGIDSVVFLTVGLNEHSKPLSEFGYEVVDNGYYVDILSVDVNEFVDLPAGSHTIFLSLVDDGKLIAIKSQDIISEEPVVEIISDEKIIDEPVILNETNVTIVEPVVEENIIEEVNASEYVDVEEKLVNDTLQNNFTLQENITLPEEIISYDEDASGLIDSIRINSPVKWRQRVKAENGENSITVDIPKIAENVRVRKIINGEKIEISNKVNVVDESSVMSLRSTNMITGKVIGENSGNNGFIEWLKGITGFAVSGDEILGEENISLVIEDLDLDEVEIEIEYETEGPRTISENDVENGKEIKLDSGVYYEDVIAYTVLENYKGERISVVDLDNGNSVSIHALYYGNDGFMVEWIVDHFSERNYGVYLGSVYLGGEFVSTSNPEFNQSASWININSALDYRGFAVVRTNNTLYCNYANTTESNLEYKWYKNNIYFGAEISSSLSSNNFMKGDNDNDRDNKKIIANNTRNLSRPFFRRIRQQLL